MRFKFRYVVMLVVCVWLIAVGDRTAMTVATPSNESASSEPKHVQVTSETVMTIGGSIAHGWKDTSGRGYLPRAFDQLSKSSETTYTVQDRTIVGADSTQLATLYEGMYPKWLQDIKPQIVVISWGLLNDAKAQVPLDQFKAYLKDEIQTALDQQAVVFLVTPPVTLASYTQYKTVQPLYANAELEVAKDLNDPNVYVFDLFNEMKSYLDAHNQTIQPYIGDGWHPNTPGHILAGQMLYRDLEQQFHLMPILYHS